MSDLALKRVAEASGSARVSIYHPSFALPISLILLPQAPTLVCRFCNPPQEFTARGYNTEFSLWYAPAHFCQQPKLGKCRPLLLSNSWVCAPEEL